MAPNGNDLRQHLSKISVAVFYFSRYALRKLCPRTTETRGSCSVRFLNQITFLFLNSGPAGERGEIVLPGKITIVEKSKGIIISTQPSDGVESRSTLDHW